MAVCVYALLDTRLLYAQKAVQKRGNDMGIFTDGFKELKKASEPLYKKIGRAHV